MVVSTVSWKNAVGFVDCINAVPVSLRVRMRVATATFTIANIDDFPILKKIKNYFPQFYESFLVHFE